MGIETEKGGQKRKAGNPAAGQVRAPRHAARAGAATETTPATGTAGAPDRSSGRSSWAQLADRFRDMLPISPAWGARLSVAAPLILVAVVLLLTARIHYNRYDYHDLSGFIEIGKGFASLVGLPFAGQSQIGNDGQYFYYLALHPGVIFSCHGYHPISNCPMPELRSERILYPATVGALSLGQPQLLPFLMLLVNFVAILITVFLIGKLAAEMGQSRWLGAAAGLYAGATLAFILDVADPFAVMWLVVAFYLFRHNRFAFSALALAAAMLSREQLIFLAPFFVVPFLARREWVAAARYLALALTPFLAWQAVLFGVYGQWPLLVSSTAGAPLVPIPFLGLWKELGGPNFVLIVLTVVLPILAAAALAIVAIRRMGFAALLREPWPAMVLFYCFLLSLTDKWQWIDIWAPTRLALPALALALIGSLSLPRSWRVGYAVLLASTSLVFIAKNAPYLLH